MLLHKLVQLTLAGLTIGGIYALLALGIHLVFVATQSINFAYGAIVFLGGLLAYSAQTTLHLPLPLLLVTVLLCGWGIGLLLNQLAVLPIRGREPAAKIIALIAVGVIVENAGYLAWGKEALVVSPFSGSKPLPWLGASIHPQTLWVLGAAAVTVVLFYLLLHGTMVGKAVQAAAEDVEAARLMGISDRRMYGYAFGASGVLGSLAGAAISPITFAGGYVAIPYTLQGFTASILGGITNPWGATLGGLLLGLIETFVTGLLTSGYRHAITMGLLLVILLLRPEGLFPGTSR